jgi:hypothetical protein
MSQCILLSSKVKRLCTLLCYGLNLYVVVVVWPFTVFTVCLQLCRELPSNDCEVCCSAVNVSLISSRLRARNTNQSLTESPLALVLSQARGVGLNLAPRKQSHTTSTEGHINYQVGDRASDSLGTRMLPAQTLAMALFRSN